eukprot:TRINITY_DN2026_c0_g1_i1.p1 TRINITY_DN2026_c0_g1~~TRINITY_DN2026_c0_g1_i1.p1  ORF type:complete len:448 (+),score=58.86 TRINITY_DN2026_c0_g1_i1:17-1360(+)
MSAPSERCPICSKNVFSNKIDEHVNVCLDGGDATQIGVVPQASNPGGNPGNGGMDIDDADLDAIRRLQYQEDSIAEKRQKEAEENERLFQEWLKQEALEEERRKQAVKEQAETDFVCPKCKEGKNFEQLSFLEACGHFACKPCLKNFALEKIQAVKCSELICWDAGCGRPIGLTDLKPFLSEAEITLFQENSVKEVVSSNPDQFTECPQCKTVIERVAEIKNSSPAQNHNVVGLDGKQVSAEALKHRDQHRLRCRDCQTEFCAACRKEPYHLGFTCDTFNTYERARKCRFCGVQLHSKSNQAPQKGWAPALQDCCTSADCTSRRSIACPRTLACGHFCGGCNFDDKYNCHPPCMHEDCVAKAAKEGKQVEAGSEYCAICYCEGLEQAHRISQESIIKRNKCPIAILPKLRWPIRRCPSRLLWRGSRHGALRGHPEERCFAEAWKAGL